MKKIISLILSIALLATLMPTILVSADETETVTLTVPITEDTFLAGRNVGDPGDATIGNPGEKEYLAVSNHTKRYYNNKILLKAAFANIDNLPTDKVVSKAELVVNRIAWDSSIIDYTYVNWINEEFSSNLYIYPASKNWNEETRIAAWIADETAYPKLDSDGLLADTTTPKTHGGVTSFLATTTDKPVEIKFDITDIFVESLGDKSLSQSSEVAFFAQLDTAYKAMAFASSEHSNAALRPYINITLIDKPELSLESSVIPTKSSDKLSFTFNNNISSATATINGGSADVSITNNVVTVDYEYEQFEDYTAVIDVTDNYGGKYSDTITFSTSSSTTKSSQTELGIYLYAITGGVKELASGNNNWILAYDKTTSGYASSNQFALLKYNLENKCYDEFVISYKSTYSAGSGCLYKYDNPDNKDMLNITYAELDPYVYDGDYSSDSPEKRIARVTADGESVSVDVADYANECVANGKSEMYLILATPSGGHSTKITKGSLAATAATCDTPAFLAKTNTVDVAGAYIKALDIDFITVFNSATVELIDNATGIAVENTGITAQGSSIVISNPLALSENASYKLVLKAGATDKFGNTLEDDMILADDIATGVNFVNHGIKLFAKDTEVEKDAFATTDGLTAATVGTEVQGYWRADNNAIEEKALIIAIGAYDDNNELLGVQFSAFDANDEETKIYKTNALTVPTGATKIKSFGWDGTSQAGIAFAEISVQ